MYSTAVTPRPVLPSTKPSHMKVENVVYAPRNPTVIAVETSKGRRRSVATVITNANTNEPEMLMSSVAHGNRSAPIARPMAYRVAAPAAPARPTQTNRTTHLPQSLAEVGAISSWAAVLGEPHRRPR